MKKKNLIIIFLVIIILFFGYIIFKNFNQKYFIIDNINQPPVVNEEEILVDSFEVKVLNPSNTYVNFDAKYPFFKKANSEFNLNIENFIKKQMDDHMVMSLDNWQARYKTQVEGDNIPVAPNKEDDKFYFSSDFEIIQSNSDYISFVLRYGGFSGGAHGYQNIISYNYDVRNQKQIELKELFSNNQEYLEIISIKSREYLKKQYATINEEDKNNYDSDSLKEYVNNIVLMIEDGTEPIEENFSVFTFTADKIKIYFSQYQVGPYSIGMPEVEIDRK